MRRLVIRTAVVLTLGLLAIAGLMVYERLIREQLQRDSSQLALDTTLAVLRNYQAEPLREHAHPDLFEERSIEFRRNRLQRLREHGAVQTVASMSGDISTTSLLRPANGATAEYLIEVDFASGSADVEVSMLHDNGRWLIRRHQIHSSLLAM